MNCGFFSSPERFIRKEHGGVAVEFAIIVPILVLLVFGIIDLSHAWYMRHLLSDASREGARYGTRFTKDSNDNRMLPKNLSPSIANYILNSASGNGGSSGLGLSSLLPANANPSVTCTGAASTEANSANLVGEDLIITVNATKTWFILGKLLPGLDDSKNLRVTTTMTCE
jgi:Flp pilus assembly protein TadG